MTIAGRVEYPDFIERASSQTYTIEVYNDANPAAVTAATFTLIKPDGTKAVDAAAATSISGGTVSYALSAASVPATEDYSTRWREEWDVTVAGAVYTIRRDAHLVPTRLYPVVTVADLERSNSEIGRHVPATRENWQHAIDEAWGTIVRRLVSGGSQPSRIISPWSLRDAHASLALCHVFTEMSTYDNGGRFVALADMYCERYEKAWANLKFDYDTDDDGDADFQETPQGPILVHSGPSAPSGTLPYRRKW